MLFGIESIQLVVKSGYLYIKNAMNLIRNSMQEKL